MKKRLVACPACAAPVEFQLSTSLVTVCDFCRSIVARADKKVADHGKVADLVEHQGTPQMRDMATRMRGTARRAGLPGNTMEIEAKLLDGQPFDSPAGSAGARTE